MTLRFDPENIDQFKAQIRGIPGYPVGEDLPIREMVFESGALWRLPDLLLIAGMKTDQTLSVVMDRTPMQREGKDLKELILQILESAGWQMDVIWLEPDGSGQVHTDFPNINAVKARLQPNSAVLSVGSGTVTDIAKHACYVLQQEHNIPPLPFVVYQTANSVSAYTSNMAPTFVDGVKRTLPSRYPDVLVCDLETLRDAPQAMTVAGVGDLLAAFGSYADWWLAYRLGIDNTYTEFAQILMGPLDEIFLEQADGLKAGHLESMSILAKLIALAGLAMSLSHATAPLSGYEHVISHVLDLVAEKKKRPLAQHGTQVALATLLTTAGYQIFMDEFEPAEVNLENCYPTEAQMKARIGASFNPLDPTGHVASECWADYKIKLESWHTHRADFQDILHDWPGIRAQLHSLVKPPEVAAHILQAVSSPVRFIDLVPLPTESEVQFAFMSAPLIRHRFTLGDMFVFLNWDRETLWAQVNKNF
ncbi:MAG: iron-containing alcohol dehydrogenase [Anaerolineae bacterium]|nr:iron-containing alcohol dehydrogenase [Anaerolineae bacterium]MCI0608279.1 iron-containing alcohol dehydrogenase [Anaerolineae bacterium]